MCGGVANRDTLLPPACVGVGGGCGGISFVWCMYVHSGNDVNLEDDVYGGVAFTGICQPRPPLLYGSRQAVCFPVSGGTSMAH